MPQSLGTIAIEYKQFGTRVDFVPIVLGNGAIRLEVRPQVSELDNANGVTISGNRIPALRTRWVMKLDSSSTAAPASPATAAAAAEEEEPTMAAGDTDTAAAKTSANLQRNLP